MEQSRTSLIAEKLTLNVKIVGEEGEHGGSANAVAGAVKNVTYS
jgi:hypothetical protein